MEFDQQIIEGIKGLNRCLILNVIAFNHMENMYVFPAFYGKQVGHHIPPKPLIIQCCVLQRLQQRISFLQLVKYITPVSVQNYTATTNI